jgi:hypothetical protein
MNYHINYKILALYQSIFKSRSVFECHVRMAITPKIDMVLASIKTRLINGMR